MNEYVRKYVTARNEYAKIASGIRIIVAFRFRKLIKATNKIEQVFRETIKYLVVQENIYSTQEIAEKLNYYGIVRFSYAISSYKWKQRHIVNRIKKIIKKDTTFHYILNKENNIIRIV